eukprot:TRINITY_DN3786_c0_g1_i3.p1 TRINITY_DN3786_c0_g1~~TRINITY_DN3786_c0_g1_i3.p1  ORF type:complete len:203 (-),score=7.89 TRINITY_DN3786_c0_g1_i3:401-1009(-)
MRLHSESEGKAAWLSHNTAYGLYSTQCNNKTRASGQEYYTRIFTQHRSKKNLHQRRVYIGTSISLASMALSSTSMREPGWYSSASECLGQNTRALRRPCRRTYLSAAFTSRRVPSRRPTTATASSSSSVYCRILCSLFSSMDTLNPSSTILAFGSGSGSASLWMDVHENPNSCRRALGLPVWSTGCPASSYLMAPALPKYLS